MNVSSKGNHIIAFAGRIKTICLGSMNFLTQDKVFEIRARTTANPTPAITNIVCCSFCCSTDCNRSNPSDYE